MRLLHTADWQIGMKAAHVGAVGPRVREERLAAARRVVEAARKHDVDFLLVAGDLFEDNGVSRVLVQKTADILGSAGRPVYIIPGNHDPLVPGSVWQHPAWGGCPDLRVVIEARPVAVPGGTLYPCPLFEKHSRKDPTAWIQAGQPEGIAVGVAHGTPAWIDPANPDYPIPQDAAARSGLDYLALGHWHSTVTYADASGAVRMAFSGTHETTKFGERDSGNVLLVEISARGVPPVVTPIRTGGLVWKTVQQEIRGPGELARARGMVEGLPDPQNTLLDLALSGILSAAEQGEVKRIEELAAARLLFGRIDASRLLPEPGDDSWLASLPGGVLQDAARQLQHWTNPAAADRPAEVTPEVAARALVDLYALVQEVKA